MTEQPTPAATMADNVFVKGATIISFRGEPWIFDRVSRGRLLVRRPGEQGTNSVREFYARVFGAVIEDDGTVIKSTT